MANYAFTGNSKFDELLEKLRRKTDSESWTDVIKEALIVYDWVISEYENDNPIMRSAIRERKKVTKPDIKLVIDNTDSS
ncbi:MAG: hypothetical protein KW802_04475 [Candidatus Doudnabacteria bacterium]|nr:hypothetical protein [Candidatus Doudnabacteria bacterium]